MFYVLRIEVNVLKTYVLNGLMRNHVGPEYIVPP